jgi:hypothetical protein
MPAKLTPIELHTLVLVVLIDYKPWLMEELSNWPVDACFDTSATLVYDERLHPYLHLSSGVYEHGDIFEGHTWMVGRGNLTKGWIIDPTIQQFDKTAPEVGLYSPDDQRYSGRRRYL